VSVYISFFKCSAEEPKVGFWSICYNQSLSISILYAKKDSFCFYDRRRQKKKVLMVSLNTMTWPPSPSLLPSSSVRMMMTTILSTTTLPYWPCLWFCENMAAASSNHNDNSLEFGVRKDFCSFKC
jgi:hypothetical protein